VYEFDTKIHLLMSGPGIVKGAKWTQIASNVDIAPTILAIAGVQIPSSMDGKSFLKFVVDADAQDLPLTVKAHVDAEAAEGAEWRDTHYVSSQPFAHLFSADHVSAFRSDQA
jgi:extracellular sulfatase Sulf